MKMETKITLTFMIMFIVSVIISGIQEVVVFEKNFFSSSMWSGALFCTCVYLIYIWIETRKHKKLANLAFLAVLSYSLLRSFAIIDTMDIVFTISDTESGYSLTLLTIFVVIKFAYFCAANLIAKSQAKKLLEEDKVNINVNITLKNNNNFDSANFSE